MATDWKGERVARLVTKRAAALGDLSQGAVEELTRSVREDPDAFVDDDEERAFALLVRAQTTLAQGRAEDEFLSDDQYAAALEDRLARLRATAEQALELDPSSPDAALLSILGTAADEVDTMLALRALDERLTAESPGALGGSGDRWEQPFARPLLRVKAALARSAFGAASFSEARDVSLALLDLMPGDPLGLRFTAAMALARLEDEKGFDDLDVRFERHGNAWSNLARSLMLFKLDRLSAARRALNGYLRLNEGAAYALLRPVYIEPYLPDRPDAEPGSYWEAALAVHEADPIIVDAPDFIDWCSDQPGVLEQASTFAAANGFEW